MRASDTGAIVALWLMSRRGCALQRAEPKVRPEEIPRRIAAATPRASTKAHHATSTHTRGGSVDLTRAHSRASSASNAPSPRLHLLPLTWHFSSCLSSAQSSRAASQWHSSESDTNLSPARSHSAVRCVPPASSPFGVVFCSRCSWCAASVGAVSRALPICRRSATRLDAAIGWTPTSARDEAQHTHTRTRTLDE